MSFEFVNNAVIEIDPPSPLPPIAMAPPSTTTTVIVPVEGPRGPQGIPGLSGDARALSFDYTQNSPATLWQINHALGFKPASFLVKDSMGDILEFANVTWPTEDIVELYFGTSVSGTVTLS